jgi:glycosyltransferase involved in cell wall biosynthesis
MRICTIAARNYLGRVEVLAESFREHHPDGEVSVLVVDDRERAVESRPGLYDVVRPEDVRIPRFEGMAAMYDITELCTAVKPWLLRHLLNAGEPVAYFDPDVCFYAPVEGLEEIAREHQIVLTPHMTKPFPDDGEHPDTQLILAAGAYNLGFIALGPGDVSAGLLEWWSERLRFDCIIDVENNYFVDQRWFDLVPGLFPNTAIMQDPGLNVAYWNVHEHEFRVGAAGRHLVDGVALKFFHFSGFDPGEPDRLSRHQTRFRLRDLPVVAGLCRDYAQRVVARAARFPDASWPFDALVDGRPLSQTLRRLYREGEREGVFECSPFTRDGCDEFIAWLTEVASDAPGLGINRYWAYLYRMRRDLQLAFPALSGPDGERYLHWITHHADVHAESQGLVPRQPEPAGGHPPVVSAAHDLPEIDPPADDDGAPWGVNLGGFLESEMGVGEAARATISALDAGRIPVLPVHGPWRPGHRQGHRFATFRPEDAMFPVSLLCVNADVTGRWLAEAGPDFRDGRYTIGLWWWEVTRWPEQWLSAFDHVDEVWVATDHIRAALAPVSTVPVTKITLPVRVPTPRRRSRAALGLPDGFLFLFMFDYWSVVERKNPLDTIEAFIAAFAPGEGAKLAIKCINHDVNPAAHEQLRAAAARHPDIHVIEGYVSAADKNSMLASADCYISLHRAEGYGLTLAESLLLGKPVIATGYSGNLDFMSPKGSWLVDADMVPIGPGNDPYPADGEWAQPDVAQASRYMREIFGDAAAAGARAAFDAATIRRTHSPQAGGATMAARLKLLRSRAPRPPRRPHPAPQPEPTQIETVASLLSRGPVPTRANPGEARSLVRRSALRAMKPYTAFEQQVDDALLGALRALHEMDEQIVSDRLAADELSRARTAKQIGVVAAALRNLESETAELSAQISASSDAVAEWQHGLADSYRGLERHVVALQSDVGARLDHLTDSTRTNHRTVSALEAELAARLGEVIDRLGQAESRLRQLETPAFVSDRARFASLAALHRAHLEIGSGAASTLRIDGLDGYELRGLSQNGEDGVLAEILTRIGAENRFFGELGVKRGHEGTCIYLAEIAGWDGLFIETEPQRYRELTDRYGAGGRVQTVPARVTPGNVEHLFADAGVPKRLDVLSIDVEGSDHPIWDALQGYRPRVVVIAYGGALPADTRLVQPDDHGWQPTDFEGAPLDALVRLGTQKGYRLVHTETSGVTAFFVPVELADGRFPAPAMIPTRQPRDVQNGYRHPTHANGHRHVSIGSGQLVSASTKATP